MLTESVRGTVPEPGFYSLSGIEQMRAYLQMRLPRVPHAALLGYQLTQVSFGTVVVRQPVSPWFEIYDGFVDLTPTVHLGLYTAALTVLPPATTLRPVNLSLRYLRPCTVDDDTVIARARVLHAGTHFITVETTVEDSLGRAVAHATGCLLAVAMDPAPPPLGRALDVQAEEPAYGTPDPVARKVPADIDGPALARFLGIEIERAEPGGSQSVMAASGWLALMQHQVEPGLLASHASLSGSLLLAQLVGEGERAFTSEVVTTFLGSVPTDGRRLVARAQVNTRTDDLVVMETHSAEESGRLVLVGRGTQLIRSRRSRSARRPATRVLLTVLFTDLVNSTGRAAEVGDASWRELLDEHDTVIRRHITGFGGREVKTTGDGFLITFDSPSRALQCAQAIRSGVEKLGLQIRAGAHAGECEVVSDDVTGLAVHIASRIQAAAEPGEVLVSHTVRDLAVGTDMQLLARGKHPLKGIEGEWELFSLCE
jgi:class 3 adenylate cyclase